MFKLVVLSALLAVAIARPSHFETPTVYSAPATVAVHESRLAHIGNVVKSVPSAISHHSNAIVHSTAHTFEDVVAPAIKTTSYTTKTLAAPIVENYAVAPAHSASVVQSYGNVPLVQSYSVPAAPVLYSYAAAAPAAHSYASAAPAAHSYAAAAPVAHSYAAAAPVAHSYAASLTTYAAASPLTYTASSVW